jgi:endo-1,4-beta-D-glucanase Y
MRYIFPLLFFAFINVRAVTNFPFPQNKVLHGIKTTSDVSAVVQSTYETWLSTYYVEQDSLARITWDNKGQTASEGIAYGMLIMVCMDNPQNKTHEKFDKLWRYYKKFKDNFGVMHWKIDGFSSVASDGQSGATDAELDAATALILAYRQWGDQKYLTDVRELLSAVWHAEIDEKGFLKPGDMWDERKNLSYFNIGAMQLFKSVDTNNWSNVIRNSVDLIKKVCDTATGLPPDWCSQDGQYVFGGFGWEAIRVPWRMAWAYSWFGTIEAFDINNKIIKWIRQTTSDNPGAIKSLYSQSGIPSSDTSNTAYTGGLTCAGMISAENQSWVDSGFATTQKVLCNTYYKKTLQVLFSLLISGNFPLMASDESVYRLTSVKKIQTTGPHQFILFSDIRNSMAAQYFSPTGKKITSCLSAAVQPLILSPLTK